MSVNTDSRCNTLGHIILLISLLLTLISHSTAADEIKPDTSQNRQQQDSSPQDAELATQLLNQLDKIESIDVDAQVPDTGIKKRITNILKTSQWFSDLNVSSTEGIVVLEGETATDKHRLWAENIAARTQGVVAVINKITLTPTNQISFSPVVAEGRMIVDKIIRAIPAIIFSLLVLICSFMLARYLAAMSFRLLGQQVQSVMLRHLLARLSAIPILLLGISMILSITGLGTLAATVIGGTGLIGLVISFAFRDIAENFLASILISIQRPFRLGDTIKVLEYTGLVQAVTTRGTILMTLEGNHVQIPNTTIYKEPIINYSANPNIRLDFSVGVGYDVAIFNAQQIALTVLLEHPAVLNDPESLVLAEELSASTVNLRIYFWVNSRNHNVLKVRSAIIRLVKHAFIANGINMPDDAREVIFPQGIRLINDPPADSAIKSSANTPSDDQGHQEVTRKNKDNSEDAMVCTRAEGELTADTQSLEKQAKDIVLGGEPVNLLRK